MKHRQNDISTLWSEIRDSDKLDPSIIKKIEKVVICDKPDSNTANNKNNRPKESASRKWTVKKSIFGNPFRNVSDELVRFYKKNKKCKAIINPVFESLSFDRKNKKFTKLPILLKDLLENLHREVFEPRLKSNQITDISNIIGKGSNIKSTKSLIKVTNFDMNNIKEEDKDKIINSQKNKAMYENGENDNLEELIKMEENSSIRNLQLSIPAEVQTNIKQESIEEIEEQQNSIKDQNEYVIDMNCNEVLSELNKSDSITVRTVQSPHNEPKIFATAEKVWNNIIAHIRSLSDFFINE